MVRTTELHSCHRRILRFTTPGRPSAAAACYVALWRLPRPDLHRLVISTFKAHQTPVRLFCLPVRILILLILPHFSDIAAKYGIHVGLIFRSGFSEPLQHVLINPQ